MAIPIVCKCGKQLKVGDAAVGKRVKCPGCGNFLRVEPPEPEDTEEEAPKARKKKRRKQARRAETSFLQTPLLGLRVGAWLAALGLVVVLGVAAAIIVPRAIPALGKDPYYTVQAAHDHLLVSLFNTSAGDFSVKVPKRSVKTQFDGGLGGIALPEYELQNTTKAGDATVNGKKVHYEITCTSDRGITEVRCDDRAVKLSAW